MDSLNNENKETKRVNKILQINIAEGTSADATNDDTSSKDHRGIYWRLLFLNLVVLWAFQSLISAQHYYVKYFPNHHIEFWGTVASGTAMFLLHILQLLLGFYKYGFTKRLVPGFIGYIIIAILVMSWKNPIVLIVAFASIGALNTLTETPIYAIAGLFPTGSFTQAVQVGNGIAGILNVSVNTIIRLIVLFVHSHIDQDQLSFYIFMSVFIILCCFALYVYYRLINIPSIKISMTQQMALFTREKLDDVMDLHLVRNELSFWSLFKILKIHLFVVFYVLFITLLLWPGIPCNVTNNGWFKSNGHLWWCSPFVIGTYNLGDLIGRVLAIKVHRYFSEKICLFSSILRTSFILIIFFRHSIDNIVLLFLITLLGITNGLLTTVTFMVRPLTIFGVNNCERATYLMTAALYLGIACGSILAAILALTHLF